MKKRRILSVLLCLALVVFSLSGCNKTSSKKSTSSKKADSGTLQGMIKSVDVDKKQITIATMPSGNQPPSKPDGDGANNNDNGTNSNGANDSGTKNNGGNSANDGKDNGNQPSSKPDGDSNAQMPQQEETVYKLNDESKLMDKDGNTITLKKLSEGDFVEFTAKNSYIVSLAISDQTKGQGEAGGGNGSSQPTEYSAVKQYSAYKPQEM